MPCLWWLQVLSTSYCTHGMELIANYRVIHLSTPALYCPILYSFTCQSLHRAHTHTDGGHALLSNKKYWRICLYRSAHWRVTSSAYCNFNLMLMCMDKLSGPHKLANVSEQWAMLESCRPSSRVHNNGLDTNFQLKMPSVRPCLTIWMICPLS